MFNYKQLVKSAFATYKSDFYNLYIKLEERNAKENKNFEPWEYNHCFSRPGCNLSIKCDEDGNLEFSLDIKGKLYEAGGTERSVRELMKRMEEIQNAMEEHRLNFCPRYGKDFENVVLSAEKGTVIVLNTKRMVVCVDKTDSELTFKECYCGDLKHLSLEAFKGGESFCVNKMDRESIQDLFDYAYNTRSLMADVRVSFGSNHGAYEVSNIEGKLEDGEVLAVKIGPIHLKVVRNGSDFLWYDSDNKKINRSLVETVFGWVSLSIPSIEVDRPRMFLKEDLQDASFIQSVQKLIKENRFNAIPSQAFAYSKSNDVPAFLNVTGFESKQNGSYDMVTFVFKDGRILKIGYEYGENKEPVPLEPEEVLEEEFVQFCKQKYSEEIDFLKTKYTPLVEKYKLDYKKEEPVSDLLNAIVDEHTKKRPPLICQEKMNQISDDVKAIVTGHIMGKSKSSLNVTDIFDDFDMER